LASSRSCLPPGIPTWFIARSHRFTTLTHWRYGALIADPPERLHLAPVRAHDHDRFLELRVRGPYPHNFFALLKNGLGLCRGSSLVRPEDRSLLT